MKDFFRRLFDGRYGSYGTDRLCRFQFILAVVFLLLSVCMPSLGLLYYVAFVLLISIYFRLFSKNITKRYHENQVFIKITNPIVNLFRRKR